MGTNLVSSGGCTMIKQFNISDKNFAKAVFSLQKRAYQIEADLISSDEIPPLKESLEDLMYCGENFIGFFDADELFGAVSYKVTETLVDIHRVMVEPSHFRKGIARKLLVYLEELHGRNREMIVSTEVGNKPACELYGALNFVKIKEEMVGNGITLARFRKMPGTFT